MTSTLTATAIGRPRESNAPTYPAFNSPMACWLSGTNPESTCPVGSISTVESTSTVESGTTAYRNSPSTVQWRGYGPPCASSSSSRIAAVALRSSVLVLASSPLCGLVWLPQVRVEPC